MNLIELYDTLIPVELESSGEKFNTIPIPEFPNFRIGVDINSYPVLLLSSHEIGNHVLKNVRLKYLRLIHNVNCQIVHDDRTSVETLTVVKFTNDSRLLQEHFLRVSEMLIKALGVQVTPKRLFESINRFVEIFRSLSDSPVKTVQGLWGELFLIESSSDPNTMLYYWHAHPEEKFDFNSGSEKIEVKSNSKFERVHIFSSEQLNPPMGTDAIIASLFLKRSNRGKNIQQLLQDISNKVFDSEMLEKLYLIVYKTLGNAIQESEVIRFDDEIAKDTLAFYKTEDIARIKERFIPNEVTEVKFKSDLSKISNIKLRDSLNKGKLFTAL